MRKAVLLFVVLLFSTFFVSAQNSLDAFDSEGKSVGTFKLNQTKVTVEISGFLARVNVEQEFENNFTNPVEAVYVFPLSQNSAVDAMTMKIGERTIRGQIMKREEAKEVYEDAKSQGKRVALLDQERPNIFTQSVANIQPGEKILVEISYVENLKFEDGEYEFVFPMKIGQRYTPNSSNPENVIKNLPPDTAIRSGNDISIEVKLDAGVPIEAIRSTLHEIETVNFSPNSAKINLKTFETIPNQDFVLRYDVTGKEIKDAFLTHKDERGGFFSLILSPPQNFRIQDSTPKEIVFVLDTSGSMSGFPIEKAKEAMNLSLEGLNPNDRFNLITFAGETSVLFENAVQATPENLQKAKEFLSSRQSGGGTEMMKAVRAAFAASGSKQHLRIVCFMTDGYVGNEAEIIAEVQGHPEARVFGFGIGNSVNRYLLDKISSEGRGEVEYVSLEDDGSKAARRFYERIRTPLLTDISIDWNGLLVEDVYPKRNSDLFSAKPLIISGRYKQAGNGLIKLKGKVGGQIYQREIPVNFPEIEAKNEVLASLWARKKIDELMMENLKASAEGKAKIKNLVTELGLNYRLLTDYTSFVAVEDMMVMQNGKLTRVKNSLPLSVGFSISSSPHGFGFSIVAGRRTDRNSSSGMMVNKTANVVNVELSTTVNGQRVVLGENPQPENNELVSNSNQTNSTSKSALNEILKRMEAHRNALASLRADVKMTQYSSDLDESEKSEGSVIYLPNKNKDLMIRIDWAKPNQDIFIISGGKYVFYNPRSKQADTGNISDSKNPFEFFNVSKENLAPNFNIKFLGEKKLSDGIPTWHLELTPKIANNYKSVELWIDGNGMTLQMKIIENNNDNSLIRLENLEKNVPVSGSAFTLNLPEETTIIKK